MVSDGRPKATSTSTRTGSPSTPSSEALSVWASMRPSVGEAWLREVPAARLLASQTPAATGAAEAREDRLSDR